LPGLFGWQLQTPKAWRSYGKKMTKSSTNDKQKTKKSKNFKKIKKIKKSKNLKF